MYSVVLLMALSGGGDVPAFGHHDGCSGCTGYVSCCGCCGGYVVSCSGCSGCCGGWASHSACTGCSGDCHGSKHHFFGKHRHSHSSCCGGCCGGCHGTVISYDTCGGCSGCWGTAVAPATPGVNEAPKKEIAPMPKGKPEEVSATAAPSAGATFVSEPTAAFEAPPAAPTEPRSWGSRIWGRLRGTSAP